MKKLLLILSISAMIASSGLLHFSSDNNDYNPDSSEEPTMHVMTHDGHPGI